MKELRWIRPPWLPGSATPAIVGASILPLTLMAGVASCRLMLTPATMPGKAGTTACARHAGGLLAHARRGLFRLAELGRAPLAVEAVHRIDCLFKVERTINGVVPQQRAALRQQFSAPIVENLMEWMHDSCSRMSGKSPTPDSATRFPKVMLS